MKNEQEVKLSELRNALIETFESFGWNTNDYDVFSGIHSWFADRLWRYLLGDGLIKEGKLPRWPKKYKHLFGKIYWLESEKN